MRILYVSQHFPPETGAAQGRAYDFARLLVTRGHDVTVLTGMPNYPTGIIPPEYRGKLVVRESLDGIKVIRTFLIPDTKKNAAVRLGNYLSFFMSSTLYGCFQGKPDVVYATVPQLFVGLAGFLLAKRFRSRFALEVRDLWVDFAEMLGEIHNPTVLQAARRLETFLYRRADPIIVVTKGYKDVIASRIGRSNRIHVIPNGVDPSMLQPQPKTNWIRDRYSAHDKFVVAYAGNVGLAQNIQTIIDAGEMLRDRPDVLFLIIGEGADRKRLKEYAESKRISNVIFVEQQTRRQVQEFLAAADALIVILKDHPLFRVTIPSKLFDYMAMERPILAGVDGEVRRIVEEANAGIYFDSEDPSALVQAILQLRSNPAIADNYGRNGREYVLRHYNRVKMVESLEQALRDQIGSSVPVNHVAN